MPRRRFDNIWDAHDIREMREVDGILGGKGRPHYELSPAQLDQVEEMSVFQCTDTEIAHALGMSAATMGKMRRENMELARRIAIGQSKGKRALRSVQFKVAISGNVNMLMYLGKVVLEQLPDAQVVLGGGGSEATDLSPAAKAHLAELAQAINQAALNAATPEVEAKVVSSEDSGAGNGSGNGNSGSGNGK